MVCKNFGKYVLILYYFSHGFNGYAQTEIDRPAPIKVKEEDGKGLKKS